MIPILQPEPMITNIRNPSFAFGSVLGYMFYSSDGVALWVDTDMALFVRRTNSDVCITIDGYASPYVMLEDHQYQEIYFSYIMAPGMADRN